MTFDLGNAILIATQAHNGQLDKSDNPYILHPLAVMFAFPPYMHKQRMVAVLHDVIEDTEVTPLDLFTAGCPVDVYEAVMAISYTDQDRKDGMTYADFIGNKVRWNELARQVKVEDVKHNMSMERLIRLDKETQERLIKKYNIALDLLERY